MNRAGLADRLTASALRLLTPLKNLVAAIFRLEHHTEPEAVLEVIANLIVK